MLKKYSQSLIGRFRAIAFLEGVSFLLLMFVAMPVKYILHYPQLVKVCGWFHGLLFVAYVLLLIQVVLEFQWKAGRSFLAFIASLLPFGTFALDHKLLSKIHDKHATVSK
ncbi:DUF3817 domain-containing protein [Solitalea sp. MAHUQ-68]|uniref:DUF3817 domain-containing protein n=1 Tax=Solitalea agri TaxID=2953739 RepID=A0A9X2JBN7_9SPHI|nr:DUF3817 domain-containing protein [Solitalea agri]MCO4291654.1 DUF3817 domain-containing protein [Solitalea agri]